MKKSKLMNLSKKTITKFVTNGPLLSLILRSSRTICNRWDFQATGRFLSCMGSRKSYLGLCLNPVWLSFSMPSISKSELKDHRVIWKLSVSTT